MSHVERIETDLSVATDATRAVIFYGFYNFHIDDCKNCRRSDIHPYFSLCNVGKKLYDQWHAGWRPSAQ